MECEWNPKTRQSFCNGQSLSNTISTRSALEVEDEGNNKDDDEAKTETFCSDTTASDLGIQHGKCFYPEDTNGKVLRQNLAGAYCSDGYEVTNLVFRVCKSAGDCTSEDGKDVTSKTPSMCKIRSGVQPVLGGLASSHPWGHICSPFLAQTSLHPSWARQNVTVGTNCISVVG